MLTNRKDKRMKMMINTFFLQKRDDAAAEDFALLGF
jgi:hypothetical protein